MVQILATIGLFGIILGLIEAEREYRHIQPEPNILFTACLKNIFFIYLLYKWLGTFV